VDPATGATLWQRPLPGYASGPLAASAELLAYAAWQQDQPIVGIVQVSDGQVIRTLHPAASWPVAWLDVAPDATVLVLTGQTFSAWDPYSGQQLWAAAEQSVPRLTSIQLGLDGLYFSPDGRTIVKRNLDDGSIRWQSNRLADADQVGPLTCRLDRDRLLVLADRFVAAIDAADGALLWRGAAEPGVHFYRHCVAKDYVVAVSVEPPAPDDPAPQAARLVGYFYDRRNDAGLLPPGGLSPLGSFEPGFSLHFRDSAIAIEKGTSLVFFRETRQH
jgi:hypothetical protein